MTEILDISVVIPVYNNKNVLPELNSRLMTELASFTYEVIYVNDHSTDRSMDILEVLSSKYSKKIRHINLSKNIGQQKATLVGLKEAIGKKIVILDGDLQDSPELISELYKKISSTSDAIYVKRKGVYQSGGRMITSILIKKTIQLISGLHYKAGSYYMFDKSIQKKVVFIASNCRYPYMSIIVAHFADRIKYVPANRGKSMGTTGYNFSKRIKAAIMAIYCSFYCSYSKLNLD